MIRSALLKHATLCAAAVCLALAAATPCAAQDPVLAPGAPEVQGEQGAQPGQLLPSLLDSSEPEPAQPTAQGSAVRFRHDEHNAKAKIGKRCAVCHHTLERGRRSVKRAGPLRRCSDCHLARPEANSPLPSQMLVSHATCQGCHKARKKGPLDCAGCHGS